MQIGSQFGFGLQGLQSGSSFSAKPMMDSDYAATDGFLDGYEVILSEDAQEMGEEG